MINSVAKADALVRGLKEKLGFRFGASAVSESRDANGWPQLACQDVYLRIKGADAVSKDIFGNSFAAFAPHVLDIADDAAAKADLAAILFECSKLGVKIAYRAGADVNAAATLELEYDLRFPTKGN